MSQSVPRGGGRQLSEHGGHIKISQFTQNGDKQIEKPGKRNLNEIFDRQSNQRAFHQNMRHDSVDNQAADDQNQIVPGHVRYHSTGNSYMHQRKNGSQGASLRPPIITKDNI